MKKIIFIIFVFVLMIIYSITVHANDDIVSIHADGTKGYLHYIDNPTHGSVIYSNIFDNKDGTFTVLDINLIDNTIGNEEYISADIYDSTTFELISSKNIDMELDMYGGFYEGKNYNYIVFGQNNFEMDENKVVFKAVKYSKKWEKLGETNFCNTSTEIPFHSGCLRMVEYNNFLYIHSAQKRHDGHQSNIFFSVDTKNMNIISDYSGYTSLTVSHSWNQFILQDEGKLLFLNHGDGSPRSIALNKCNVSPTDGKLLSIGIKDNLLEIPGKSGENYTGVYVGGFETSVNNYIIAANAVDFDNYCSNERNAILLIKDKINDFSCKTKRIHITDYYGTGKSCSNIFLVKLKEGYYIVLWNEYLTNPHILNKLKYVYIDENGNMLTEIKETENAELVSDCQPVIINDRLIWYTNETEGRTFFIMEPEYTYAPITPIPHAPMCGDDITWELDDNGTLTITGEGNMYDFYYEDYWKDYKDKIKRVVVNEGITHIGISAFFNYQNLESISLSKTVNSVGVLAFKGTPFYYNNSYWDNELLYIGDILIGRNFDDEGSSQKSEFYIKAGTRVFADEAFAGSSITKIFIPESVEHIGSGTFDSCHNIKNIVLPPHIKTIGDLAFENCESLEQISVPNGVQKIEDRTFAECSSLNSIELPNSVTAIHAESFSNCRALKDIYYTGTEEEWNNIRFFDDDLMENAFIYLGNTTIHYNSHMPYIPPSVSTDYKVSGNKAIFTVTSLDGRLAELPYTKLYLAEYDTDGQLINVKTGTNSSVEDNKIIITSDIPQTSNYKFMLWGRNNSPLIQPITDIR